MMPGPGIEPGTHWLEESALTTAPSLLPSVCVHVWAESILKTAVFGKDNLSPQ